MALITALLGSASRHLRLLVREGWGAARGPAGPGEGPGFPDGLAKTCAGAKPRAAMAKAGLGRGLLLGSVQATQGSGRTVVSLPPPPPGRLPAGLTHKMAEGCSGHFVQPQEDKGSRQPGAGRRNVPSGSAASWLHGGPGGPGRGVEDRRCPLCNLPPARSPGHPEPPEAPSSLPGALGGLGDEPLPGAVARMPSHLTEEAVQREALMWRGRGGHRLLASQAWPPSG